MLERIREGSQGLIAQVIIGLVILTFALAGVGSYLTASSDEPAATVNGKEIPQSSFERAYQTERSRMENQFGAAFSELASDATYLKNFRQGVLDRLIAEELMTQVADDIGLRVSDSQIRQELMGMPEFQLDGQFNNDRYIALLRQAGYQPSGFVEYLRGQMTRQQVAQALLGSEFALDKESRTAFELQQQTRDLRFIEIVASQFATDIQVSDEEMQAYYQQHIAEYDTQEQVSVEYVSLNLESLIEKTEVTEEELQSQYDNNLNQYRTNEERKASHILFEFGEDEEAAKAEAEKVLAELNGGADFAEMAKAHSADSFSAEMGGDLDWSTRGSSDPAFDDALFVLEQKGDISAVVKTGFGFHIIKLMDIKPEEVTPFSDVKEELTATVKREKANTEFFNLQQRMNELAFEIPDTLEELSAEIGIATKVSGLFSRSTAPQALSNGKVINAAFSSELIEDGVNSELLEISPEQVMVLRIEKHEPVRTRSFDDVSEGIKSQLLAEKSQQKANEWASSLIAMLEKGEDVSAQLAEQNLSWQDKTAVGRFATDVDQGIKDQAFKMTADAYQVVDLISGNTALVQLTKVNGSESIDEAQLASVQQRLSSNNGQLVYQEFIESLKAAADIQILLR